MPFVFVVVVLSNAIVWTGRGRDSDEEDNYVDVEDSDEEFHIDGESLGELHDRVREFGDVQVGTCEDFYVK